MRLASLRDLNYCFEQVVEVLIVTVMVAEVVEDPAF
jgi:hypothetical protein